MKWFRHMSDAGRNHKMTALVDRCGWDGYGRWWHLVELISEQYKADGDPEMTCTWRRWRTMLDFGRTPRCRRYVAALATLELLIVRQHDDGRVTLRIPKLSEMQDEYTRKSGQRIVSTPDKCPDKVAPEAEAE